MKPIPTVSPYDVPCPKCGRGPGRKCHAPMLRWELAETHFCRDWLASNIRSHMAEMGVEPRDVVRLSQRDGERLAALLENPPEANDALKEAVTAYLRHYAVPTPLPQEVKEAMAEMRKILGKDNDK